VKRAGGGYFLFLSADQYEIGIVASNEDGSWAEKAATAFATVSRHELGGGRVRGRLSLFDLQPEPAFRSFASHRAV
jgi:hypothetical protein